MLGCLNLLCYLQLLAAYITARLISEKRRSEGWSWGGGGGGFQFLTIIDFFLAIHSFHITRWLWKPVHLDGHHDWLHFDTYWSLNNCTCSCMRQWHDSFRSRGIKIESTKVAIQLHWFLWPPRYVKLVYLFISTFCCWLYSSGEGMWTYLHTSLDQSSLLQ